jgi:hypothetical protein
MNAKLNLEMGTQNSGKQARCQWLMPAILATQGRDQKDSGSKPAWGNSSQDPILKNHITKRAGFLFYRRFSGLEERLKWKSI